MKRTQAAIRKWRLQRGQTTLIVILMLSTFLLGFIGFAVDFTNLWFHRQAAQGAADAACQAGGMNMLTQASTGIPSGGFTPPTRFDCSPSGLPTSTPCRYAALNGYPTSTLGADESNLVSVSFPGSVSGVTPAPGDLAPQPFIRVDVTDRVRVFFSSLLSNNKTQDVRATAICGLVLAKAPIPIIVLNPVCQHSFQLSGGPTLKVVGGPNKSVQINSGDTTCAAASSNSPSQCSGGSGVVDLSRGGENFTGSNFGVYGAPPTQSFTFDGGTTGRYASPSSPIADPYFQVPAPTQPPDAPLAQRILYNNGTYGCPDPAGCILYKPGFYSKPIVVSNETAVFVPGIYYIKPSDWTQDWAGSSGIPGRGNKSAQGGGLCGNAGSGCTSGGSGQCRADFLIESLGIARMANNTAPESDGNKGVMFYMSGTGGIYGSVVVTANAGSRIIDSAPSTSLTCDGSLPNPNLGVPANLQGNILVGQCTGSGSYIGAPNTDTAGNNRGMLFFQDRANGYQNGQANMQGGGGLSISGTIYAHNCTASPCNDFPTDYRAFTQLQGGSCSDTVVIGEIITDQLNIAGNGCINMALNTNAIFNILKVQLVR